MVSYYSFLIVLDELINSNNRTDLQTAPPTSKASIQPVQERCTDTESKESLNSNKKRMQKEKRKGKAMAKKTTPSPVSEPENNIDKGTVFSLIFSRLDFNILL